MPNFRINKSAGSSAYYEYSTTEHIVGKWIDEKTVYERTIILRENHVDKYPYSNYLYDVGLTGVDKVWLTGIYAKRGAPGNTEYIDIISNSADVVIVFKHTDGSIYVKDTFDPTDIIVNIRYTKVID